MMTRRLNIKIAFATLIFSVFSFSPRVTLAFTTTLPSEINFDQEVTNSLSSFWFSTNITNKTIKPAFVLGSTPSCSKEGTEANIEVFLINPDQCTIPNSPISYRVLVRNTGDQPAYSLVLELTPPEGLSIESSTVPKPFIGSLTSTNSAEFSMGIYSFPAHHEEEYTFTLSQSEPKQITAGAIAHFYTCDGRQKRYDYQTQCLNSCWEKCQQKSCEIDCVNECAQKANFSNQTVTQHTLNSIDCSKPNVLSWQSNPGPVTICRPGDESCTPTIPSGLGKNFQSAQPWLNNPQLGVRFKEAIGNILPGECATSSDAIIQYDRAPYTAAYAPDGSWRWHDALLRQYNPSSSFMEPLYNSGQDFWQLTHENELLGIENELYAKEVLSKIHTKYWNKLGDRINEVLAGKQQASSILSGLDSWEKGFKRESNQKQQELKKRYSEMQTKRQKKFQPVAEKAIENAKTAIARICQGAGSDGGLSGLLPIVQQAYEAALKERENRYDTTQNLYLDPDRSGLEREYRPSTWKASLQQAVAAFNNRNSKPLKDFLTDYVYKENKGFEAQWDSTYEKHFEDDKKKDYEIRMQYWEISLDKPKEMVGACFVDSLLKGPTVETSWCESSGNYPATVAPTLTRLTVKKPQPPQQVVVGQETINDSYTRGTPCGRGPGDPYWADDCSCNCDDIVLPGSGGSSNSGSVQGITSSALNPDYGRENISQSTTILRCGDNRPITRHDINVKSKQECMNDPNHFKSDF